MESIEECHICLGPITSGDVFEPTICKHTAHLDCFQNALSEDQLHERFPAKCSFCRSKFCEDDLEILMPPERVLKWKITLKPKRHNSIYRLKLYEEIPTAVPITEPTAETTTEPTAETTAETTSEPTAETNAESSSQPIAESNAKPSTEPDAEVSAKPTHEVTFNVLELPKASSTGPSLRSFQTVWNNLRFNGTIQRSRIEPFNQWLRSTGDSALCRNIQYRINKVKQELNNIEERISMESNMFERSGTLYSDYSGSSDSDSS